MRKLAVINFKGGTGKTTTVVNLGHGLAQRGQHVLLVDVDAQGSLALSLGVKYSHTLADLLTQTAPMQQCIVRARKNLDLLPSDQRLMLAQKAVASYVNWQGVLGALLQPLEGQYDLLLLDCAASITPLNINALTYADEILIPTQVEYLSLAGLNQVLENLARIRFPNRPRKEVDDLGISLIIPTMYDVRMRQSRRLLAELRQTYGRRVAPPIRINVRLSEAPSYQKTIFEYAPHSRGAFDYSRLADLVLQQTLLVGEQPIGLETPFHPSAAVPQPAPVPATLPADHAPAAGAGEETSPPPLAGLRTPARPHCPYCNIPMQALSVAGYRVLHCERCGYQKQVLLRDLRSR